MQPVTATLDAILTDAIATGKAFDPVTTFCGVFTAINDQGLLTVLANLTLPTGGSATNIEITAWSALYHLASGAPVVDGPGCGYAQTGADATVTIVGWYLTDANPGTVLKAYGYLPTPVILAAGGTRLTVLPRLTLSPTVSYSAEVIYDG